MIFYEFFSIVNHSIYMFKCPQLKKYFIDFKIQYINDGSFAA